MDMINFDGLLIGIATFLIIGLFHPVVVKAEYYWGTKCWWIFLVLGIAGTVASLLVESVFVSAFTMKDKEKAVYAFGVAASFNDSRARLERLVSKES
mgnify:CR=1 FL=1